MNTTAEKAIHLLFDEEQFRGQRPGEQTYALLLLQKLSERTDVKLELLTSGRAREELSPRCRDLVNALPGIRYTKFTDLEPFPHRPRLWQKVLNRLALIKLRTLDGLMETRRLGKILDPAPDILHLSRFRRLQLPKNNRPLVFATVHDLIPLIHPEFFTNDIPDYVRDLIRYYMEVCDRIHTVSEKSREDLLRLFPIDPEKVETVACGTNPIYRPAPDLPMVKRRLKEQGLAFERYFLWVGTIEPRKNFTLLNEALLKFSRDSTGNPTTGLVIVGSPGWMCTEETRMIEALEEKGLAVHLHGISDEELCSWYSSALALVMPSFYEGFGSPVAEALTCACPVITSSGTTMEEIAQGAAELIDPHSSDSLLEAMRTVSDNSSRRREMKKLCLARAELYTADRCADLTMESYRRAIRTRKS